MFDLNLIKNDLFYGCGESTLQRQILFLMRSEETWQNGYYVAG